MDDQHWERADALLAAALELPRKDRDAFVEKAAAGDAELEALVHRLLRHAEDSGEELIPGLRLSAAPGQGVLRAETDTAVSPPGTVLGRYRLLGELGRGGMAVVYRAERVDGDFEQQVALKQILDPKSEGVVRRLEQERQILARATHPDMARLLDGGLDANGRPYLVMELVDGVPIDEYCDRGRPGVGGHSPRVATHDAGLRQPGAGAQRASDHPVRRVSAWPAPLPALDRTQPLSAWQLQRSSTSGSSARSPWRYNPCP